MGTWLKSVCPRYAVALLAAVFVAWVFLPNPPANNSPMATTTAAATDSKKLNPPDLKRAADHIADMTNEVREHHGVKHVNFNSELTRAAEYFAKYMASTDKYSHTADGKSPSQRAEDHGYDYCLVSENIAYVYSSTGFNIEDLAEDLVRGWQDSPEHRKNMLDRAVTEIGVAVAHSTKTGNYYGVQMFGRPKSLSFRFAIENKSEMPIDYNVGERTFELSPHYRQTHEECLPAELVFHLPARSKPDRYTFRPQSGDVFIVVGPPERLRIEKKEPSEKEA
jgi:uncharacterized protein YkwD